MAAARAIAAKQAIDRVEMTDEPLVLPTAQLRETLGLPGLSVRTATLCRDKTAMKEHLRAHGIPCAASRAASTDADVREFAERNGFPIIVKPRAGFGALNTHRVESAADLDQLLPKLQLGNGRSIAVEEFVDGHEGFYDTIMLDEAVGHEFVSHYYPGPLEATVNRAVSPQIAVTNRLDAPGYRELEEVGRKVNQLLGLSRTATHMEWFFGSKGLYFSEVGARPAGERIWDMYRVANEFDVYREWASAVVQAESIAAESTLSRGVHPDPAERRTLLSHEGLDVARREVGPLDHSPTCAKPAPRAPLSALLVNTTSHGLTGCAG